jgi:sugar phosphate isomerase/epimerase
VLSYSFRGLLGAGQMDVFGYLEACRHRYGLGAADIWNGFLPTTDEDFLYRVKDALDERDLELADLCVDRAHVWDDDPQVRAANHRNALAHLRAAEILGARFVRIDAGSRRDTWSDAEFDHIVSRYQEYARFAHERGFKMGAENHWGPERHWPELRRLYLAVDHPGFGISCHIGGWAGSTNEVAEADRRVAPWVCHTHLPWDITEGPLEEKMVTLRDAGYTGYYSVEHHSAQREYAEVGVQLARVRAVLDGWRVLAADGVFASREGAAGGAPPAVPAPAQPAASPNSGAPGVSTVVP